MNFFNTLSENADKVGGGKRKAAIFTGCKLLMKSLIRY